MLYELFQNIEFANNWVLPFLLMLPVIAWLYFRLQRNLRTSMVVSSAASFTTKSTRNYFIHWPFYLRLLALACVLLALARPQTRDVKSRTKGQGIDIMLCIDVSGSMLSQDFQPNRMEVAKKMAAEFVKRRPVDRIGLVIFSGESYTQFPLSTDHENLLEQLRGIRSGMLQDGTLIGEGLATSVDRLKASKSGSRVVVLLTDGKEEAPDTRIIDPATALSIAQAENVKVYTIGMAAENVSLVDERGMRVSSSKLIDETLLRRIAQQTNGAYFRATDPESL
ncbi:MAG TPA: VWA domain-containing protein, partial [Flavisolibacter sp.]